MYRRDNLASGQQDRPVIERSTVIAKALCHFDNGEISKTCSKKNSSIVQIKVNGINILLAGIELYCSSIFLILF
jgi:hypothetical protein